MIADFGPLPARERYVPNDIGPSPDTWLAPRLEQVSTLITNGFVGTATPFYTDHTGVKYLYGQNVRENHVAEAGIRYITKSFHDDQSKTRLRSGDILTVQSGHIGVTAVVPPSLDGANCHALIVTRLRKQYANPEFVSQYLNSEIGKARLRGLEVGSTILHINTKDLKKFRIPLPALAEQVRIVDFLRTWDRAIETVAALIATARAQKQALMQQLLTGKRRLPGFSDGARIVSLSEIAKIETGSSNKEDSLDKGKYTFFDRSTEIRRSNQYLFDTEAIIIGGEGQEFIPKHFHGKFDLHQRAYALHSFKEAECRYVFYATHHVRHLLRRYSVGSTVASLRMPTFQRVNIWLPSLPEQEAISARLTANDDEILGLQSQLTALRQEKAALMQQLLTGKRRVKVDLEAETC